MFLSNTGPDPHKLTKLPIQYSKLGHYRPASEASSYNNGLLTEQTSFRNIISVTHILDKKTARFTALKRCQTSFSQNAICSLDCYNISVNAGIDHTYQN